MFPCLFFFIFIYLFIYIFKNFLNLFPTNLLICLFIHFLNYLIICFLDPRLWPEFFLKKSFCPQNGENGPEMGQKQGFLNLFKNLVINFFWIWSVKKFYNICSIAQIPCVGKIWFLNMGQNALNQSDWSIDYFKLTISLQQNDEKVWFFAYWCRFIEIKSWLKNIGLGMVKIGCGHSGLRTLKLAVS